MWQKGFCPIDLEQRGLARTLQCVAVRCSALQCAESSGRIEMQEYKMENSVNIAVICKYSQKKYSQKSVCHKIEYVKWLWSWLLRICWMRDDSQQFCWIENSINIAVICKYSQKSYRCNIDYVKRLWSWLLRICWMQTTASKFAGWKIASILWLSANILRRNIAATLTI